MGGPDPEDHGLTHGWGAGEKHTGRMSRKPGRGAGHTFCLDHHVGQAGLLHELEKRTGLHTGHTPGLVFHAGLECKLVRGSDYPHWWSHGLGLDLQIWLVPSSK